MLPSVKIQDLMEAGVSKGLAEFAALLLKRAQEQAPPSPVPDRDPDPNVTLKDAGEITVEGPRMVIVGFHTLYAAKIHENVRAKHPDGGKAKYLEDPLKELAAEFPRIVAADIHKRFSSLDATGRRLNP